jgi:hypothetical protein
VGRGRGSSWHAGILLTVAVFGAPFATILEGLLDQVGGVTSLTVTVNEAVAVFPAASCKLTSKGRLASRGLQNHNARSVH